MALPCSSLFNERGAGAPLLTARALTSSLPGTANGQSERPVPFKEKKNQILIYMFSDLIIYFMLAVSSGWIFHFNSFNNPRRDY